MHDTKETAEAIKEYESRFADELRDYANRLRQEYEDHPDEARPRARQALLRTGVLKE